MAPIGRAALFAIAMAKFLPRAAPIILALPCAPVTRVPAGGPGRFACTPIARGPLGSRRRAAPGRTERSLALTGVAARLTLTATAWRAARPVAAAVTAGEWRFHCG
jgi:hypothetical protein